MIKKLLSLVLVAWTLGAQITQIPQTTASSRVFTQTASVTVANTAAETSLVGSGVGSVTLPANFFTIGKVLRVNGWGYHSAAANPSIEIKIKLGSTIILDTTSVASNNSTNQEIRFESNIVCRTTGASGTVIGQGRYEELTHLDVPMVNTGTATIDTTASQVIDVTAQWSTASSSDSITVTNLTIEYL